MDPDPTVPPMPGPGGGLVCRPLPVETLPKAGRGVTACSDVAWETWRIADMTLEDPGGQCWPAFGRSVHNPGRDLNEIARTDSVFHEAHAG